MRGARGFTLWELLWTLGIAAVGLATGVPAFTAFRLDASMTADVNAWVLAVHVARTEAAKRGRPVIACRTADTLSCGSAGLPREAGFMVYVNLDDAFPPQRSANEPLLYVHTAEGTGPISSNRAYYEFRPGRRSTNGTTVFCDRRGAAHARAVIVSYTGRPRVSRVDASQRPLRCGGSP